MHRPEKTKITHISEGFDFLGWNIRKYNGKLLMKPSKTNIKAHLEKVRDVIKENRTAQQVNLIRQLNPILRGWMNYHRHVVAKETFARNDKRIWSMFCGKKEMEMELSSLWPEVVVFSQTTGEEIWTSFKPLIRIGR